MNKLTLIFDHYIQEELTEYLLCLNGICKVIIKNNEPLTIEITYNSKLINIKIIKLEILFFLNLLNVPSLLAFDKHSTIKNAKYKIIINNICCEYCFKNIIEDLFEIKGIDKIESNFDKENYNMHNNIIINIKYNPNIININDIKKIELNLNI